MLCLALGLGRAAAAQEMVSVPAGTFTMGSARGDPDERPEHPVQLGGYRIDRYEVTQAQYERCVRAGACRRAKQYAGSVGPTLPAVGVTWDDATRFCAWAGKRLPSEAEWEKAARGTDGRLFPWGNRAPDCSLAAYALGGEKYCRGAGGTAPAADYAAATSPYGVLQMAGNVFSWVADWHDRDYYAVSPERNPTGPVIGKHRVVRGGSWFSPAVDLRSAIRNLLPSGAQFNYLGFRCVSTAP
jgi:formylglycine-generating enzyme required for sulfatase activity